MEKKLPRDTMGKKKTQKKQIELELWRSAAAAAAAGEMSLYALNFNIQMKMALKDLLCFALHAASFVRAVTNSMRWTIMTPNYQIKSVIIHI